MGLKTFMTSIVSLLAGAMLLSGCVTQAGFPNKIAEATCEKYYECSKTLANATFQAPEKCVETIESVYDRVVEDCKDWDGKRAAKCIDEIEDRECGSLSINAEPCADLLVICK